MSLSNYKLNQRLTYINYLLDKDFPQGKADLQQVLTNGNNAQGLSILNLDNLQVNTINNIPYPARSSEVTYNILTSTNLNIDNIGYANITSNIKLLFLYYYNKIIYFLDSTNNSINNINLTFSDNLVNQNINITLLSNIDYIPIYKTVQQINILDNSTNILYFGNISLTTNGDLIVSFSNINISNTSTYTLSLSSFIYY